MGSVRFAAAGLVLLAIATSYAYVNPVLAVLLGAALNGEPLGATTFVANALIVIAVALALTRPRSPTA